MLWRSRYAKDDKRIKAEYTFYSSPKGNAADGKMRGLLARPASGDKFPVVVVIHENRGLNPYIEDVARRLAASGFMALAPDAIWPLGGYPSVDKYGAEADEKALGMQKQLDGAEDRRRFRRSGGFLAETSEFHRKTRRGRFLLWRRHGQPIGRADAAVGRGSSLLRRRTGRSRRAEDQSGAASLTLPRPIPILPAGGRLTKPPSKANGTKYEAHVYPKTNHGFHNDTTPRFNEGAAKLAWQRTLDHFNKNLKG